MQINKDLFFLKFKKDVYENRKPQSLCSFMHLFYLGVLLVLNNRFLKIYNIDVL